MFICDFYAQNKHMKNKMMIIICIVIFMFFSLMNIYVNTTSFLSKQIIFFVGGFTILLIFLKLKCQNLFRLTFLIYLILNALLLYLLLFGSVRNGSRAWLDLGFFSFQPSELMKIVLIILLAIIINMYDKYFFKSIIITLIPAVLTFLEPDTGNVIFYFVILLTALLSKTKNSLAYIRIFILGLICSVLFMFFYFTNESLFINIFGSSFYYRMDRLVAFANNSSYQLKNALIGIGSGGLVGHGLKSAVYIPEAITDFAFSLLLTNTGFMGSLIYLSTNLLFNFTIIKIINNKVGVMKSVTLIFLIMKVTQDSIHMLMNIGLFPITGITLPFISYGGSSLISYFIITGLILNSQGDMDIRHNKDLD